MAPGRTRIVSGLHFDGATTREAHLVLDGATSRLVDGPAGGPADLEGLIVPAPVNAHTHLGDTAMRDVHAVPPDLAAAVAPPDGVKHRFLAGATPDALQASIARGLAEAAAAGTGVVADFRESGPDGIRAFRAAAASVDLVALAFGRPATSTPTVEDCLAVAEVADGLGLSGLGDVPASVVDAYAEAARRSGKPLALHWSEARREDLDAALALDPAFLVHACHATDRDLARIADAGVGVVVCPRSNALFGGRAPVAGLVAADAEWAFGSDNGWFHPVDVWQDGSFVLRHVRDVPPETVMSALVGHGRKVLNLNPQVPAKQGHPARWAVLATDLAARDPVADALRTPRVLAIVPG